MRILSIVGARPQFVKLAALHWALDGIHEHLVIHTGQHYDHGMSDVFFDEFHLPLPNLNLGIGSGPHGVQTAKMIIGIEAYLLEVQPDWVLAYGDTNSTIAGALAAAKIGIPIAHVEAGLRSGDRSMPEEVNRILTDHASELCLAPTEQAMRNLQQEGLSDRSRLVGDVMVDVLRRTEQAVELNPPKLPWDPKPPYIIATLHRQALMESKGKLSEVFIAMGRSDFPVFLVAHPRLSLALEHFGLLTRLPRNVLLSEPLSNHQMVYAVKSAQGVITDSGGLQKEAFLLQTPCLTVRETTEWPETLEDGWNRLIWENPGEAVTSDWLQRPARRPPGTFGEGDAADIILGLIEGSP